MVANAGRLDRLLGDLLDLDRLSKGILAPQRSRTDLAALVSRIAQEWQERSGRRPTRPGVGIGLSLVARFAELHGGRAWVQDRPGGGASFRVLLPD